MFSEEAIYLIKYDLRNSKQRSSESIFIEMDNDLFQKDKTILIGVIHRTPNTNLKLFNDDKSEFCDSHEREHEYCYLMGDYDINIFNYGKHAESTSYIDILCAIFISTVCVPLSL